MDTGKRLENLCQRLRNDGLRLTPQRLAIVRAVFENCAHPSIERIHAEILKDYPTTSLATVYKTVNLLKAYGEVLELGFGEQGSRYDGRWPQPHPHIICTRCNEIKDLELSELDEIIKRLADCSGYQVNTHRLDIFGLCPACRK